MPDDEWTDWPENDCTREHPKGRCKVTPNSFKITQSQPGRGTTPFVGLPALWPTPRRYEAFQVDVHFDSGGSHACCCCEYRQRVKGRILHHGTAVTHELPGGNLSPDQWREDGIVDHFGPGQHLTYGHRDGRSDPIDEYYDITPARHTGCQYIGLDAVNVPDEAGWKVDVEFEGLIIDVCRKRVVTKKYWRVRFDTT
jgi:hypothetical protein